MSLKFSKSQSTECMKGCTEEKGNCGSCLKNLTYYSHRSPQEQCTVRPYGPGFILKFYWLKVVSLVLSEVKLNKKISHYLERVIISLNATVFDLNLCISIESFRCMCAKIWKRFCELESSWFFKTFIIFVLSVNLNW